MSGGMLRLFAGLSCHSVRLARLLLKKSEGAPGQDDLRSRLRELAEQVLLGPQ
jgi:hypothetical protein